MSWSDLLIPSAVLFLLSGAAYFTIKFIATLLFDMRA